MRNRALVANLVGLTMVPLLACGCGHSAQTGDGATEQSDDAEGTAPSDGSAVVDTAGHPDSASDAPGLTVCEAACTKYASVCGAQSCSIDCPVQYEVFEGPACDREFGAYFSCVAALPVAQIKCAADFLDFVDAQKCPTEFNAMFLCESTKGADCAPEPAFDDSCSVTNKPPHFNFCKVGVQPPAGCVAYGATTTGWFCCP